LENNDFYSFPKTIIFVIFGKEYSILSFKIKKETFSFVGLLTNKMLNPTKSNIVWTFIPLT
jgi:hypothetical protein